MIYNTFNVQALAWSDHNSDELIVQPGHQAPKGTTILTIRSHGRNVLVWTTRADILTPNGFDVLGGRGSHTRHHPGNQWFTRLANHFKEDYRSASLTMKTRIIDRILADTSQQGRRFLKLVPHDRRHNVWKWTLDPKPRTKIVNKMRDMTKIGDMTPTSIPLNSIVLASPFMESHRANKVLHELSCRAFKCYGDTFSPSWIAKRVVDGVLKHNPPLIFCLPKIASPRSTSDLAPVGYNDAIDLVTFVLRMLQRGRNGYDCLRRKLVAIEDWLFYQNKYSATEVHDALFFNGSYEKEGCLAANEETKMSCDLPKSMGAPNTYFVALRPDHLESKQGDERPETCLSEAHIDRPDDIGSGNTNISSL